MKNIYFSSLIVLLVALSSCGKKTNETKPIRKDITETVFASGSLEPENKYNLISQSEGYIVELKFNNNDEVKAGQLLAIIDNKTNAINASSTENLTGIAAQNACQVKRQERLHPKCSRSSIILFFWSFFIFVLSLIFRYVFKLGIYWSLVRS